MPNQVVTAAGGTGGTPNLFTPTFGDSSTGGTGQAIDSITCNATMPQDQFHIHSFVGVLVNGGWYAMPTAIGMVKPGAPTNGSVDAAQCFYLIHTHDSSGIIHQEAASSTPESGSLFTLGNLLDIWGQPISANGLGSLTGMVRVFVATVPLRTMTATTYSEFTGDPRTIQLFSHEAIWIEVGPPYILPGQLPPVNFYTEY